MHSKKGNLLLLQKIDFRYSKDIKRSKFKHLFYATGNYHPKLGPIRKSCKHKIKIWKYHFFQKQVAHQFFNFRKFLAIFDFKEILFYLAKMSVS